MAKKLTKTATKKGSKRNLKTKKIEKKQEDSSTGIMVLAGIGLILLIYFGSTVSVDVDVKVSNETELIDTSFIISGKTYSSKKEAKKQLTGIPQSQLTDEEIKFVEGYQE